MLKTTAKKGIIVLAGIALNVLGRAIANYFNLPIWFDMMGTFIASYYTGIWGGIIAGLSNNILSGFYDVTALVYSVTSVVAALMMGLLVKKNYMNNPLRVVVASFWMGIICTVVSTPLNLLFYNGYSGNSWGDTLVDMLRWYDVPNTLSALAGEAVVEILDKQVCVVFAYLFIYFINRRKKRAEGQSTKLIWMLAVTAGFLAVADSFVSCAAEQDLYNNNFVEKIYNNTNGMVSSEANTICETEDGYIWIGSYAGLTRYDGNQFEFVREGGLVNVVEMMTDSRGRLWIGTNDAGIARYENGKYTYFTKEDGLASNSVRCFAEDKEGTVYVGTSDTICSFSTDDTIEVLRKDITFAKAMTVYNDMLIVLDNNGGLYALDKTRKLEIIDSRLRELFYYCLAPTSYGLMVGTETGELLVVEVSDRGIAAKKQINIPASQISAIFEDRKGRVWVATESGFGYLSPDGSYEKMNYEGFDSSIVCFHEDYQGNIWAASTHYGVMKLSESSFMNLFEKVGIEKKYVNAVLFYNGNYYCGTDDGLIILDGSRMTCISNELTSMTSGSRVRSLFTDSEDRLWACTYSGLFCYDLQGEITLYNSESYNVTSDRFRCITEQGDGTIVAGTADGINYIKDGKLTGTVTSENGLANTQILSIVEGYDGRIWAGSDGSGIYILSGEELVENYTVEDGLSSNIILRIVPHEDGYFVVTSNALCHIDLKGNIRRLENFPYFNNYDIIVNEETAYVTCSAGLYETELSRLCGDSDEQYRFYGAGDGLFSGLTANSWNYVSDSGRLYLCSNNGVIVFKKYSADTDTDMKYGITSIVCDGTEIMMSGDNPLAFPPQVKNLSIYASVRNYGFTDVKVRFYIKELDDNPQIYSWNEIEPIKLYKPELSEYTICLQILDNSGENVLQEKNYRIGKEMKNWEKPVFKTYLIVVCIEILLFTIISIASMILFVIRKNELEKLQVDLEKKVREQTEELRNQQIAIKNLFLQTVTALSEAVDAKDRYTSGHAKRVAEYARMIAARMGKSKEEQEAIYRAGLLHDIGKIRIPAEIIDKPGKLTDEEYNIIKLHPVTGYHILRGISDNNYIAVAAKYHHERYDGNGYPNGLAGEKIPEVARILGVADAYDAMASNRSYRDALPQEVVRSEIERGRGTQFDPHIADIMLQMIDEDKEYRMKQTDSMQRKILTIDDEPMNNKIIAHIMRDEPMYQIVSVCSGKEALEVLEQQSFDLIMLDVKMPEMDGLETLRRIRQKYDTPVVLMTSDRTLNTSTEFEKLGCDDYITKPFLPLLIKEIVHNMTERTNIE
ncbi:MAG: HD domain-containing phosphohydrolase [Acetatifactor sp.]